MSRDRQLTSGISTGAQHFIMIAADRVDLARGSMLEAELRRIGLRPKALLNKIEVPGGAAIEGWQVHFGSLVAIVASASADPALADPGVMPGVRIWPAGATTLGNFVGESRELFKLAVLLLDLCAGQRFYWAPADLWTNAGEFRSAVAEMLESGMPPVLHLVGFTYHLDKGSTETRGLAHFCGQELLLDAHDTLDRLARMRRLVRLAVDMMLNGPINGPRRFPGLAAGEYVEVEPGATHPDEIQHVLVRIVMS